MLAHPRRGIFVLCALVSSQAFAVAELELKDEQGRFLRVTCDRVN